MIYLSTYASDIEKITMMYSGMNVHNIVSQHTFSMDECIDFILMSLVCLQISFELKWSLTSFTHSDIIVPETLFSFPPNGYITQK